MLDQGDSGQDFQAGDSPVVKAEVRKLIKYFLASIAVPQKDLWVNLSPYEKYRIVPDSFGKTEMGRDLLAQDYILKQITASLIYPEDELGKKFWKRVYEESAKRFGTAQVEVNTFNKVWIVPEKAVVYENAQSGTAYVVESKLKVMLDEDYLALNKQSSPNAFIGDLDARQKHSGMTNEIIREVVIPQLYKEINEGQNFAQLRQVYNSLILAFWYKKKIKDTIFARIYSGHNKVQGILSSRNDIKGDPEQIYQHYVDAFKKGVYSYIKEEQDPVTHKTMPRKYFSGGTSFNDEAMQAAWTTTVDRAQLPDESGQVVDVSLFPQADPSSFQSTGIAALEDADKEDIIIFPTQDKVLIFSGAHKIKKSIDKPESFPDPMVFRGVRFEMDINGMRIMLTKKQLPAIDPNDPQGKNVLIWTIPASDKDKFLKAIDLIDSNSPVHIPDLKITVDVDGQGIQDFDQNNDGIIYTNNNNGQQGTMTYLVLFKGVKTASVKVPVALPDPQQYEKSTFDLVIGNTSVTLTKKYSKMVPNVNMRVPVIWTFAAEHYEELKDALQTIEVATQKEPKSGPKTTEDIIEENKLAPVISALGDEPALMLSYLYLTTQLDPKVMETIVRETYEGFVGVERKQISLDDFQVGPGSIHTTQQIETQESSVVIKGGLSGKAVGKYNQLKIEGGRSRVIDIDEKGSFKTRIILKPGEQLDLQLTAFNSETSLKSKSVVVSVHHNGKAKTIDQIILEMLTLESGIIERIQGEGKLPYLVKKLEESLLIHFTENEDEGFTYLDERIKEQENNNLVHNIYQRIKDKFKEVQGLNVKGLNPGERLYFYQKYAVQEVINAMLEKKKDNSDVPPARILAIDQGLGKTLIGLVVARSNGKGAFVVAPNSLVSMWAQQASHFFNEAKVNAVTGTTKEKADQLKTSTKDEIDVVNIEFIRPQENAKLPVEERFEAINKKSIGRVTVFDEGQPFSRQGSLQREGAAKIKSDFTILLSATPFAHPQAALNLINFLREQNGMSKLELDLENPDSIRQLHFLLDQIMLRIRKHNVLKTYDPEVALEQQKDRVPRKDYVTPQQGAGAFTLSNKVADAIFKLFTNWDEFEKDHGAQIDDIDDDIDDPEEYAEMRKKNRYFFTMMHTLRRLINHPRSFNIDEDSPKQAAMDQVLDKEIKQNNGKVVIFAAYKDQVERYLKRYGKKYGAVAFYGDVLKNFKDKDGFLINKDGELRYFAMKNEHEYRIVNGRPLELNKGDRGYSKAQPIKALDYNRLLFQNDPNVKVLIATYNTGSLGETFTAADAIVFDDLPRDYTEMYQAQERINRIDNLRKKYTNRFYVMQSQYPQNFAEQFKGKAGIYIKGEHRWDIFTAKSKAGQRKIQEAEEAGIKVWDIHALFSRGTFDEVQYRNFMNVQARLFRLVLDGLEDPNDLEVFGWQGLLREQLPFLFNGNGNGNGRKAPVNAAMTADSDIKGGIDLSDTSVQQQGDPAMFAFDQALDVMFDNVQGFAPVVLGVTPIDHVQQFLGQ